MTQPQELDRDTCVRLLQGGVAGRVAICTPTGPHIVPINYSVVEGAVIFRTSPYSVLGTHGRNTMMAFEIDHLDYENHRGWSVVVRGRAAAVTDTADLQEIRAQWPPRPWAEGHRSAYFKLVPDEITGRRIGEGWTADNLTPVRRVLAGQ